MHRSDANTSRPRNPSTSPPPSPPPSSSTCPPHTHRSPPRHRCLAFQRTCLRRGCPVSRDKVARQRGKVHSVSRGGGRASRAAVGGGGGGASSLLCLPSPSLPPARAAGKRVSEKQRAGERSKQLTHHLHQSDPYPFVAKKETHLRGMASTKSLLAQSRRCLPRDAQTTVSTNVPCASKR